ncbi:MAG: class II aldolase/adducin family protein [Acidimicrobiales bacterium]
MDSDMVDKVVEVARQVVASGAIAANGHGNVSLRVPGADEMYFTGGSSLRDHPREAVARVGLDGVLREGQLPPIQAAVVAMHTAMYADRADVGCVLHTHSPFATAYAVAQRQIGCWIEALAMFGLPDGVPVARYGPRGSDEAVANIRAAASSGAPALLLANHGVLVFHRTPELAVTVGGIVEEAARAGINAGGLGGPVSLPDSMKDAALQRAAAFEDRGVAVPSGRSTPKLPHGPERLAGKEASETVLKKRYSIRMPQGIERGPLMADGRGIYVMGQSKRFGESREGRHDILAWSDVVSYSLTNPAANAFVGRTTTSYRTVLALRTASGVHSFDLPFSQARLMDQIGTWLANVPTA